MPASKRNLGLFIFSSFIDRAPAAGVCGGLVLDMGVGPGSNAGRVQLRLPITNNTEFDWQGSVSLKIGSTFVPVEIGEIKSGETASDTVSLNVDPGEVEVNGSLLIGP